MNNGVGNWRKGEWWGRKRGFLKNKATFGNMCK